MRLRYQSSRYLCYLALALLACTTSVSAESPEIKFDRDIRPILADKCYFCHGPDKEHQEADLRLDVESDARAVITAGDPTSSELITRILATDDSQMPPKEAKKELSPEEISLLKRWVQEGAEWSQHWSFSAPTKAGTKSTKARDVIDEWIAKQIPTNNLADEASREKLLRRVTYDLTGMPPTLAELDAFLADTSPDAYETVVDRLLASPRYGQRMGLAWLDAARYGDTSVYHADGPRDMWGWRDAIVDAYNQNMPFDEFSIAQIAGDLLPEGTAQQKVLAGFNRNNGTTDEGGAFAEEYRVEYAVDRVKTTSTVWMGLTMECAQCHDHKYDPISQEEYYKFFAFFNVSSDGGMQTRRGNAAPTMEIPDPAKQAELPNVQNQLTASKKRLTEVAANCGPGFEKWLEQIKSEEKDVVASPAGNILYLPLTEGSKNKTKSALTLAASQGADTEAAEGTDKVDGADKVEGAAKIDKAVASSLITANIKGKAEWIADRGDFTLKFNGSNWVDAGSVGDFERSDSFSYGGWIKPAKNGGQGALIAKMDDGNKYRGFDLLAGNGPVSVHLVHTWPDNAIKVTTKKKMEADKWHHVFAVYDGSSKASGIKIYVDGQEWEWKIEQDRLKDTIKTEKTLLVGSRHPGSRLKAQVDDIRIYDRALDIAQVQLLADANPITELLAIAESDRTDAQNETIKKHYLTTEDKEYPGLLKEQKDLESRITELKKPLTTVMVMGNQPKPRKTFILNRGAYDSPTEQEVSAGTLGVLPAMDETAPRNRLGMSQWLFSAQHPLTSRVTINRYWQMLFGRGLVSTPEDFGAQGDFPTHPELLDWLAVDFLENDWNVKRILKEMVLSRTYRQSSASTTDAYRADPDNHLLSRGPRFRLQGEFIRDTALTLGGLLNDEMGGAGVKPYQPPGLWAEVGLGGNPRFTQDHGEKLYRRSIYTYWKRSAPPPSMQIFDAPTREKCIIRRARTNTPLQALVTLNDTQFVEASRHMAERLIREGGTTVEDRVAYGFRLATSRYPTKNETAVLQRVFNNASKKYSDNPEAAANLLSVGESKRDESLPTHEHAAWTIVSSSLLNLDETLTRE